MVIVQFRVSVITVSTSLCCHPLCLLMILLFSVHFLFWMCKSRSMISMGVFSPWILSFFIHDVQVKDKELGLKVTEVWNEWILLLRHTFCHFPSSSKESEASEEDAWVPVCGERTVCLFAGHMSCVSCWFLICILLGWWQLRFGILLIGGDGLQKYVTNSRGMEIFVKSWMPEEGRPKGILFLCHGYGDTVTFFFEGKCSSMYCIGFYIWKRIIFLLVKLQCPLLHICLRL